VPPVSRPTFSWNTWCVFVAPLGAPLFHEIQRVFLAPRKGPFPP
jgi:hypothetical protein